MLSLKAGLSFFIATLFAALPAVTLSSAPASAAIAQDIAIGNIVALTVYLPLRNELGAEATARLIQTPGNANYHHFLHVSEFVSRYGASDNELANLEKILEGLGFTIQYVYPNHLAVEAVSTAGNAEKVLGLTLKRFTSNGRSGIASTTPLKIPTALVGKIRGIAGFNTLVHPRPHHLFALDAPRHVTRAGSVKLVGGTPGDYLPADFARFYNVEPIYKHGVTGRGTTIGIVTLNDFKPADAYSFWKQIGLRVSPTRISKVSVDGGLTAPTNNAGGEGETDLDVEQSGALAPDAKIRVYIAPNISDANFINAFEAAASENLAETISTSWGEPELYYFYDLATKTTGDSFLLQSYHDAFLEMALQGQTLFASSGDSGSFDTVRGCPVYGTPSVKSPTCNAPYAVDHPAADPLVAAAGGTTLPLSFVSARTGVKFSVKHERAWSWTYLAEEAAAQGKGSEDPVSLFFSVGDGGGVSSYWPLPWYQLGTGGINATKPNQYLTENDGAGGVLQYLLPANFHGRNLPDISTNADPESGYQYLEEGQIGDFEGGTSFVAPQLNGVTALFIQALGGRVGQIGPALYQLGNRATPDIASGDNWGYKAVAGYDDAAGIGKLDATRLLTGLAALRR